MNNVYFLFFFFQAEDGIRDYKVTGVQTCALPISAPVEPDPRLGEEHRAARRQLDQRGDDEHHGQREDDPHDRRGDVEAAPAAPLAVDGSDRKSTRLNSSHLVISYAVFCLKKKKKTIKQKVDSDRLWRRSVD